MGIAIGYIAGFLTYYNALSDVESTNATAMQSELDNLKGELEKSNVRLSVLNDDNEKLRTSLSQIRADNEALRKSVDSLQKSIEPNGSLARIERGMNLLYMASEPMPFAGQELVAWRLSVVNETAKLDPALVPTMLTLVDAWSDIVQFEENEPEPDTDAWNQWNIEWQVKALKYIAAYNSAVSQIIAVIIHDVDSLKASLP
ncbi:MAG: regulator of replication initiation timing [Candidatus Nitrosomirales archaeon]